MTRPELTDYGLLNRIDRVQDRALRLHDVNAGVLKNIASGTYGLKEQIIVEPEQHDTWENLVAQLESLVKALEVTAREHNSEKSSEEIVELLSPYTPDTTMGNENDV
jgi:hypothetical protein